MSEIENLFVEETLLENIKIAAYFILLYEYFEDKVISTVRDFYSCPCMVDGKQYSDIDDAYIRCLKRKIQNGEVRRIPLKISLEAARKKREAYKRDVLGEEQEKDAKVFRGSLRWLQRYKVISSEDYSLILSIRKRRNALVHELLHEIGHGLMDRDAQMIASLLNIQQRINSWRFLKMDMPVMGIELPENINPKDVIDGDDAILQGIFRILFCGEGQQFKEALEKEYMK